jgi:hypothetical protein
MASFAQWTLSRVPRLRNREQFAVQVQREFLLSGKLEVYGKPIVSYGDLGVSPQRSTILSQKITNLRVSRPLKHLP